MRTPGDVCRRGMESALANWPLVLIRIAEGIATLVLVFGLVVAAVIPIVFAGVTGSLAEVFSDPEAMQRLLLDLSPFAVLYAIGVVTLILVVAVVVHSFVQAGVIGIYVIADRRAPEGSPSRADFRAFEPELWWAEAMRHGWRFFWIYNVIWGAFGLVLLLPLLALVLLLVVAPEHPAALAVTCLGTVAVMLLAMVASVVVFVWSQLVLIETVRSGSGVAESMRRTRELVRGRIGTIVLVSAIFFALSFTVGSIVAGISFGIGMMGSVPGLEIAFIPFRILISLLNSIISAAFGAWLLAAFVASVGGRREAPLVPAVR